MKKKKKKSLQNIHQAILRVKADNVFPYIYMY